MDLRTRLEQFVFKDFYTYIALNTKFQMNIYTITMHKHLLINPKYNNLDKCISFKHVLTVVDITFYFFL